MVDMGRDVCESGVGSGVHGNIRSIPALAHAYGARIRYGIVHHIHGVAPRTYQPCTSSQSVRHPVQIVWGDSIRVCTQVGLRSEAAMAYEACAHYCQIQAASQPSKGRALTRGVCEVQKGRTKAKGRSSKDQTKRPGDPSKIQQRGSYASPQVQYTLHGPTLGSLAWARTIRKRL